MTAYRRNRRHDDGFTLVEVVIVVSLIGLVATVIAAVFVTIVRTTPANEDRTDDSRALLGLTTWLPQDVGSGTPASFLKGPHSSLCGSGVDAGSQGLLQMSWNESGTTLVADYRWLLGADGLGRVIRYSCRSGGAAVRTVLTVPLPPIPATATPPLPSEYPAPVDITFLPNDPVQCLVPDCRGVKFDLIVLDDNGSTLRSLLSLDAYTANVQTTLPPTTTIGPTTTAFGGNTPPHAADLYVQVRLNDAPYSVAMPATDADGDTLSLQIYGTPDPELHILPPPGPGNLIFQIDAQSLDGAVEGGTYTFEYVANDGTITDIGTVTVHIDSSAPPATTTTTTTVPCSASIVSVNPSNVVLRPNGRLDQDVVVTVSVSGNCIPLVLSFDPDTTDANTTPVQIPFGAATAVTIGKNDHVWKKSGARPWSFALQLLEGANGNPTGTAEDTKTLVVY